MYLHIYIYTCWSLAYLQIFTIIRLLQANLNHCRAAQDLMQTEREHRIDISLISEPYRIPSDLTWVVSTNGTAGKSFTGT